MITYNAAISACEKKQAWPRALLTLARCPSNAVSADVIACSAAISACSQAHAWEAAWSLFAVQGRVLGVNMVTYTGAISACEKGCAVDHLVSLLLQVERHGLDSFRRASLGSTARML
eukprot:UN3956